MTFLPPSSVQSPLQSIKEAMKLQPWASVLLSPRWVQDLAVAVPVLTWRETQVTVRLTDGLGHEYAESRMMEMPTQCIMIELQF